MMTEKRISDIWCSETGDIGFTYDGVDLTFKGNSLETFLNELIDENEQLKQFIKELTSRDGKIWLSGGYVYDVKKVLKDGDVE